jgi:hypothetical protein
LRKMDHAMGESVNDLDAPSLRMGHAASAQEWAEQLRPFYESLPRDPAPERHWDLLIQLVLGPDLDLKQIRAETRA